MEIRRGGVGIGDRVEIRRGRWSSDNGIGWEEGGERWSRGTGMG